MRIKAHSYLSDIKSYKPGKAKLDNRKVIKLSSNENALGASPKAQTAYQNHNSDLFRYADGSCQQLREKLAEINNINADQIVCGAGSDEIIALLTQAFAKEGDEIIYSEHGFLMYPISAKRVGAKAIKVKETNLKADIDNILDAINEKTKIIFIANPNNPTGSYLEESEILKLIDKTPKNILIVLDHAYEEFCDEVKNYPNAIELVDKHENIVTTRTFSKIYGLASLRLGWCYSSEYIADILNKIRGPFNVGGPAQAAGIEALNDKEFLIKSKEHNKKWLKFFFDEFKGDNSIKTHPSVANFILFDFGDETKCQKANQILLDNGIILREMSAYGLPNCLRATIGTEEENIILAKILKNI